MRIRKIYRNMKSAYDITEYFALHTDSGNVLFI